MIDNNIPAKVGGVPESFKHWANQLREVESVRQYRRGKFGAVGGGVRWWAAMPERMRAYLLYAVAPDDWERYLLVKWDALPDGLRSVLSIEARATIRALDGCPWR